MLRAISSAVVVVLLAQSLSGQGAPPAPHLTEEAIDRALTKGLAGLATPHRTVSAAIYTPLVRVALAAEAAFQRSHVYLRPEDLPPWITSPHIWVVFREPCRKPDGCMRSTGVPEYYPGQPAAEIAVDDHPTRPPTADRVRPVKVTSDLSFRSDIGGLPFEDAVLAAAFEPQGLRPGRWVFAYWVLRDGLSRGYASARITDAVLRALVDEK